MITCNLLIPKRLSQYIPKISDLLDYLQSAGSSTLVRFRIKKFIFPTWSFTTLLLLVLMY